MPFYEVALDWKHRNVRRPGPVEDRFTLGETVDRPFANG
jgi:hypothetical protein